ncbi:hypothetical protein LCGC14_3063020, partial [marine sediment metagenome]
PQGEGGGEGSPVDAIELYNPTGADIVLDGWWLSDTADDFFKFQIPAGTTIPAYGYVTFYEGHYVGPTFTVDETNEFGGTGVKDFALSSSRGDDVWLLADFGEGSSLRFADHVEFGAARLHETFGRWPNGSGKLYPMQNNTLGEPNDGPRIGPLIFSEIHYNPSDAANADDLEYVEIYNPRGTEVVLTDWRIRGGIDFNFAEGTTIGAMSSLVVLPFDPADVDNNAALLSDFLTKYTIDASAAMVGGYTGRLNNAGGTVRLQRPDASPPDDLTFIPRLLEDEVTYDVIAPWPPEANGQDFSLNRLGVQLWGHDPTSWTAGVPTPGTAELDAGAEVVGRHVFYNNSDFDGNDPA